MSLSDLFLVMLALICIWLVIAYTDGGGGGHRSRVPVRA